MDPRNVEGELAKGMDEPQQNMDIEQPPQIFKLNVDCFEKVFDYLSIKDLHSFGQTCKRMQRVAGHFYQQEFSGNRFEHNIGYVGFREYTENLSINCLFCCDKLNLADVEWEVYKSVKRLHFTGANLEQIKMIPKKFLNQIEEVTFILCKLKEPFESVLTRLTNARSLKIEITDFDDEWVTQKNPKLERLKWYTTNEASAAKFQTFLRQNPTIRSISMKLNWLLPNETAMMELKLDDLWITTDSLQQNDCEYLNKLHSKGVYKQLHISTKANQRVIDRLSSLNSLVRFIGTDTGEMFDLSSLVNLEVFTFINLSGNCVNVANKPALAKSLQNLNEVNFFHADIDDILPFVHLSPKLKKVVVFVLPSSKNPNQAIDPVAMNREREKLLAKTLYVRKVTIYIRESNYLATKWKTTEIDLKLIEIKRIESLNFMEIFGI